MMNHFGNYMADAAMCVVAMGVTAIVLAGIDPLVFWNGAVAGFLLWQVAEWGIHKFILHRFMRHKHWQHHLHPLDDASIAPLWVSQGVMFSLWLLLPFALGILGGGLFFGITLGYTLYSPSHWLIHTGRWPTTGWLGGVARRHVLHHRGVECNYNVLFPFADMAFGTYMKV